MRRLIILIGFLSTLSFAQSEQQKQFQVVRQLFDQQKYYDAITEAKRLLFFSNNRETDFEIYMLVARSYRSGAKFSDALKYFFEAERSARTVEDIYAAQIEAIKIHILKRTPSAALKKLDQLLGDEKFSQFKNDINYWKGWAYIFDDDWRSAAEIFRALPESHSALASFCDSVENQKYSVSFAKTMSTILPGSGQIYAGNYMSGILSLTYCAGLIYIAGNAFVANRIFDALMVANFLGFRFYRGNLHNAEQFAIQENIIIANDALSFLQFQFKGKKP